MLSRPAPATQVTPGKHRHLPLSHAFAIRLCVEAVEELFLAAGASSLDENSPIQRHWRDVHAVAQHVANNFDTNLGAWGERALGIGDGLRFG
jgi:alkylation response protein AidB-like acyl-CoA dehydrogenase